MAIPISGSIVHIVEAPTPDRYSVSGSRTDSGIGIMLPMGKSEEGLLFKQSFTTMQAAKSNVKNLILTMRGERVMHPTLGTSLWSLIMEPMDNDNAVESIKQTIRENVRIWLPYLNIDSLDVLLLPDDNKVNIQMELSLKNDPTTRDTMFLSVSKGEM